MKPFDLQLARASAQLGTPIPLSFTLQPNVRKQTPSATIPADASQILLSLDASWFTDPTATISWGVEHSTDNGQTWLHIASGSRPGGTATGDGGVVITTLDIGVSTFGSSWDMRGDLIRAFLLLVPGVQPQGPQAITGTLTLS